MLAVCVMAAAFPNAALAAGTQPRNISVGDTTEFAKIVAGANDGDIIEISGMCMTNDNQSNNAPWVIDKAVTIRGVGPRAKINLRAGGIVLGADVTFEDLELEFPNNVRSAIMANGHILTLSNITCSTSTRSDIHLFCGGVTGLRVTVPPSGPHGIIRAENCTGFGNVYAGSISSDGQDNSSSIPATVTISGNSQMGEFYACGALETYVSDNEMLNPDYEVAPPAPSTQRFPVTGEVTFNIYYTSTSMVDGATGGSKNAAVVYTGKGYSNGGLTLKNLSKLTVGSGENLTPAAGSSLDANTELAVPASSVLGLNKLTDPEFASLQGGGTLVLDARQTLVINGSVSEKTRIGIGGIQPDGTSKDVPAIGHVYVRAPQSADDNFELICHNTQPNMTLVREIGRAHV